MHLCLMRHGQAADAEPGQSDAERVLTGTGIRQVRRLAEALARGGFRVDHLLHSPLVRARQTAEVVAGVLGITPEPERLLRPGCGLDDVYELVRRGRERDRLMLVGHQPYLGHFIHALTGASARVVPASIAIIELQTARPQHGVLAGFYDPALLAALGEHEKND